MDGGSSWKIISDFGQYYLNPYLENTVYVINRNELYVSTDNGDHWQFINQITAPDDWIVDLEVDPIAINTLYASTYKNGVLVSYDEGKEWQTIAVGENIFVNDLACSILDSGHTILYAATRESAIQSIVMTHGINAIQNSDHKVLKTPVLYDNFPNPFNAETTIKFSLLKTSHVLLQIYDITGKYIKTVIDSKITAGIHTVRFHAENLASGIYLYRLSVGGYTQTRTMLLIQ